MKWLAVLTLFVATQAAAHHGWSEYDAERPLKLTGTIEESGYSHPHGIIRLKTADKTWTVVLAPPTRMEGRGLPKEAIAVGSQVSVDGYPNRGKPDELRAERIITSGKTTELR